MAKFQFAFHALKKFRASRLLFAKKEMFEIESQLSKILQERERLYGEREQIFDPAQYQILGPLIAGNVEKIRQSDQKILAFRQELERHRNWVTHLGRELKIVEKLEEKKKEAFDFEQLQNEKRKMDGWVAERWSFSQAAAQTEHNEEA